MLGYFPPSYPDEILYSWVVRYSAMTANRLPQQLSKELFDDTHVRATIDLPSHLDAFAKNTKHLIGLSSDDMISEFTLFPFYRPFLSEERRLKVIVSMKGNFGGNIHTRVGINASQIRRPRYPYYCPVCLQIDVEKYGETYWHRMHQIPGLKVCPLHDCYLNLCKPDLHELDELRYIRADAHFSKFAIHENRSSLNLRVAQELSKILTNQSDFDLNLIDYRAKVEAIGYTKGSYIDQARLQADFTNYFTYKELQSQLGSQMEMKWITEIVSRPKHLFNPIRHVLLNLFLNSSEGCKPVKVTKAHPFGNGPWKCINKAAPHFGKPLIDYLSFHIDKKSKRVIGTFKCSCGMIYTKSFSNNDSVHGLVYLRILVWGQLWHTKLNHEYKKGKSLREIAKGLGTDAKTVSKWVATEGNNSRSNSIDKLLAKNRSKWLCNLKKLEHPSVNKLRRRFESLYAWLYRNDHDWLMSINIAFSKRDRNPGQLRLDWKEIDNDLCIKLEKVLVSLKKNNYRGRITKSLLLKAADFRFSNFANHQNELKASKNFIEKMSETVDDYKIRRICKAIDKLKANNQPLKRWRVLKLAGLTDDSSSSVIKQFDALMKAA